MRHVLFVCGKNRRRSPTAEQLFAAHPGVEVASAGLDADSDTVLTPELLGWADLIFVMEPTHRRKLSLRFRAHLKRQKIVCLGIRDEYEYMDEALKQLLNRRVLPYLG